MIRFLYHRRFLTVWSVMGLVVGFSLLGFVLARFTSSTISFLELIALSLAAVTLFWLGVAIYLASIFPKVPRRRLSLYLVDTCAGELTGYLEDLGQVGVLNTLARDGKTLYQKPNDLDSLTAAHYADLALVDGEGVRWLRGADNELGLRELPGFRYGSCGPFERRPARRRVDVVLDDVGKGPLGVLSKLEQLGAVGRWETTRGESAGYFGTITDAEPSLPSYTWGTRVWWETLAAEGVLYLREGDTVTFAPHAVRGFLETERCFNRLAESFMRLHTFAVGTSLDPGSRRAELLESKQL